MKNNTNCFFLIYGMSFEAKLRFRLLGRGQPQPHERPLKLSKLCDLFSLFLGVSDEKTKEPALFTNFSVFGARKKICQKFFDVVSIRLPTWNFLFFFTSRPKNKIETSLKLGCLFFSYFMRLNGTRLQCSHFTGIRDTYIETWF